MKRGFKKRAEERAIQLRQQLSLQPWDRLASTKLALELGVDIVDPEQILGLTPEQLAILLELRADEWSAVTLVTDERKHLVIENPSHGPKRREATRMHELAHIILQHRPSAFDQIEGLGVIVRGFDQEQEDEADWFGRCIHLPKPLLSYCLNRGHTPEQMSDYCNASPELVRLRLNMSGVLAIRRRMRAGPLS